MVCYGQNITTEHFSFSYKYETAKQKLDTISKYLYSSGKEKELQISVISTGPNFNDIREKLYQEYFIKDIYTAKEKESIIEFKVNNLKAKSISYSTDFESKIYYNKELVVFGKNKLLHFVFADLSKKSLETDYINFISSFKILNDNQNPLDFINQIGNDYEKKRNEWYEKYNFEKNNQGVIYRGENSYVSTRNFLFELNSNINNTSTSYIHKDYLTLSVAKKGNNSGLIYLSFDDSRKIITSSKTLFSGDVLLYLDDNSVIKCIDRNINGYSDNISSAIYFLNSNEIEQLKNSRIKSIAFSTIKSYDYGSTSNSNSLTGECKDDTTIAVQALFLD